MHVRPVSLGRNNTGKSAQKCYSCTEEGMVQKRACKVTTCWVYKCTYIQLLLDDPPSVNPLQETLLHAATTTHKKAMLNTTLEQIQTSTMTEMELCLQNIQYKANTLV